MSNLAGMNKILQTPQGIESIQNAPATPVEDYGIFEGSEEEGRNYDVLTTQSTTNGITLYYTPETQTPAPAAKAGGKRKRAKSPAAPPAPVTPQPGHRGLGPLNSLPVSPEVIFSHGGGRGIRQPGFVRFVSGVARAAPVLCFRKDRRTDEKETLEARTAAFHYFLADSFSTVRALGGRSFGGRCATRAGVYSPVRYLILWSYPLLRDMEVRSQELLALSADTKVLFIRGTKDFVSNIAFVGGASFPGANDICRWPRCRFSAQFAKR